MRRAALAVIAAGTMSGGVLQAQSPRPVRLQLHPLAHDTLRMRIDQTIEMGRTSKVGRDSVPFSDLASIVMQARLVVESVDSAAALVLAIADSVRVTSSPGYAGLQTLRSVGALQGRRIRFRMKPDASTTLAGGDPWAGAVLGGLLSHLPATLPGEAVTPGEFWTRSMNIPMAGVSGGSAQLSATFHLDSLSRSGEHAFISVLGQLQRASPLRRGGEGGVSGTGKGVQTSGDVSGTLVIDLRRGWITEARSSVSLHSEQTSAAAGTRVRIRITQWMRVL